MGNQMDYGLIGGTMDTSGANLLGGMAKS